MKNIENGGPAFPQPPAIGPADDLYFPDQAGMTLRDYFAARVLQGMCANPTTKGLKGIKDLAALMSYEIADAMIKAREVQ